MRQSLEEKEERKKGRKEERKKGRKEERKKEEERV